MKLTVRAMVSVTILGVLMWGCEQHDAPFVTTDMHDNLDHGHDHDETVDGAHAHSRRHGRSMHGGKVFSIGHTHQQDGETHFHAEVLPVEDGRITFYLQSESADGNALDLEVEAEAIDAYVNQAGADALRASEVSFSPLNGQSPSDAFSVNVPDDFSTAEKLSIVIPKINLDGNRFTFSFEIGQKTSLFEVPDTTAGEAPETPELGEAE